MIETVNYGISKNYLTHWGIKEALREIMQNFMDYGDYNIVHNKESISISSNYIPSGLEFLALGNSDKKEGSRGKYGEGLKMALLIFAREGIDIFIQTQDKTIRPIFVKSSIGETFAIEIEDGQVELSGDNFVISFGLPLEQWEEFYNSVIKEEDIIFEDNYYGRIVNKEVGNIYCGGLFVCNIDNISRAYDINVAHLPLTRDRSLPQAFDVNWNCSKINEKYGKIGIKDLSHSDTLFVDKLPEEVKVQMKPIIVGNAIQIVYKEEEGGEDIVVKNDRIRDSVLEDSFFAKTVKKLRNYLMDKMGVYDMLLKFKEDHVHSSQANEDFNLILEKIKNEK